jgi:nucleoside-diphosphate-sugar epimerase
MTEPSEMPEGSAPGVDSLPAAVANEEQLEEVLSRPTPSDVAFMAELAGDVAILGAGGKMGPSLARRIKRASETARRPRRVAAVSRFSSADLVRAFAADGIEALACDLLDPAQVGRLPHFENVLYLAGMKFGTSDRPDLTWALNTIVPANVSRHYARSRVVVFSTGNVYPMAPPAQGGSVESDAVGPVGEYAQSCLGRERLFEHAARERGTRCLLLRLFYAVDLRYGVLVDLARKVLAGEAIDLRVGYANVIWQGDANSYALRCLGLASAPARALNVAGPEVISVRETAERFGRRFGRTPRFLGTEGPVALLGNASLCRSLLGEPVVSLDRLMGWVAHWVETGGRTLGKPTHFEQADGRF